MRLIKKIYSIIKRAIKKLLILTELFLFIRLALKFLNANPKALVVNLVYKYSDVLISPFNFIFPNIYYNNKVIETATISAMIGYGILVFVFFKLLYLFSRD